AKSRVITVRARVERDSTTADVDAQACKQEPARQPRLGRGPHRATRNKLAQDFIDKVYEDWQAHGAAAIIAMREQSPSKYCALVASLIPQHFKVEDDHTLMLNEDELRAKLLDIRTKLLNSDVDPELLGPPVEEGSSG